MDNIINIILTIFAMYLAIGLLVAIVGFIIMLLDEEKFVLSLSRGKVFWGFLKTTFTWVLVLWDLFKYHKHRDEINDFANKFEKKE